MAFPLTARKLAFLQRQVAWHTSFALTVADDLEEAAAAGDAPAACYFVQAFVASCLTLSHLLWPGGRRFGDRLSLGLATELRDSLQVAEASGLAWDRVAPLGVAMQHTQQKCAEEIDLPNLVIRIDGQPYPLRPLIAEVRAIRTRAVDRLPSPPGAGGSRAPSP